ncbi:MAG TPA: hypothetical protein VKX46_06920, partial [Ktedonobacteraceae bacterium]|nr:hypothetical protein [Ktedonobacteraceae bacterium]HLI69680.1 hypothetical protein [Ktedonobacteraceae bacterium]
YSRTESQTVIQRRLRARKMNQEHTQQHVQLNNASLEKRSADRDEQASLTRGGETQMHICANCDIEFFWSPTVVQGHVYCCAGCAAGGPCSCDYSLYHSASWPGFPAAGRGRKQ